MIWQAMDKSGDISEPSFSDGSMTAQVYITECLKKRLIPFIIAHHKTADAFSGRTWQPHITRSKLRSSFEFVPRNKNPPPNFPQGRAIENFWAICKSRYSARKDPPKALQVLKQIWARISKGFANTTDEALMGHAAKGLRGTAKKRVLQSL